MVFVKLEKTLQSKRVAAGQIPIVQFFDQIFGTIFIKTLYLPNKVIIYKTFTEFDMM